MPSIKYKINRNNEDITLHIDSLFYPGEKPTNFYPGIPDEIEIVNIDEIVFIQDREKYIPWNGKLLKHEEDNIINELFKTLKIEQEEAYIDRRIGNAEII